jgi:hypothetical protein
VASSANLLAVDTEGVERLSAPAENELQNVVKLFQRKVVRYRNQPGDERANFQQYDPEGQVITTRWGGHEPTLPIPDPRPLGALQDWRWRRPVGHGWQRTRASELP